MSEELQPQPLPEGVRLMTGSEAIVIMQRLFQRAGCPIKLKQNMTMAGVLQLAEFWLDNVEERERVLREANSIQIVPAIDSSVKPQ